jgi:hypothetical protein
MDLQHFKIARSIIALLLLLVIFITYLYLLFRGIHIEKPFEWCGFVSNLLNLTLYNSKNDST